MNQLAQHHGVQCFTVEHLMQDTEAVVVLLCGGSTKEGRRGHQEPSAVCFHLDPSTHPSPTPAHADTQAHMQEHIWVLMKSVFDVFFVWIFDTVV